MTNVEDSIEKRNINYCEWAGKDPEKLKSGEITIEDCNEAVSEAYNE